MFTFQGNLAGVAVNLDFATLPAESQAFLAEYGLRQYLQDGAAVSKVHASGDKKGTEKTPDEIEAEKREGVQARVENVLNGTFTRRSAAEPTDPVAAMRQRILVERITAAAKASKTKIPPRTGKDANPDWWNKIMASVYEKNKAAIDKETNRRLKDQAAIEVDLSA